MSIKTRRILCITITALIFLILAACYKFLPDQIPTHWGMDGDPDFSSKRTVWAFGGMAIVFNIMFEVLPHIDPRYRNYMRFIREYNLFCVFMNFYVLAFIIAMIIQGFQPGAFEMVRFVCVMVGITLLVAGNIMPKFKSNFSSGFKTPWALSDEENWRKTNRLGGKLMFFAGMIWLLGAFLITNKMVLFFVGMAAVLAAVIVPYVKSYLWWKQANQP